MGINLLATTPETQTVQGVAPTYEAVMNELKQLWESQQIQTRQNPLDMIFGSKAKTVEVTDEEEESAPPVKTVSSPKLQLSQEDIQDALANAGKALAVILCGGGIIGYFSVFITYKNSLNRYEKLNTLMNHPNARVAHGDQVEKVTQQVKLMQQEVEAKQQEEKVQRLLAMAQTRKLMFAPQQPVQKFQVPTLKNLPVKKETQAAFQYSLCESIDYQ
jgi:hypothetical protein